MEILAINSDHSLGGTFLSMPLGRDWSLRMTERIGSSFEKRAARYDNPLTAYIGERELRAIRTLVPPGSSLLDFGCGTGRSALDHARRGCKVTAYDLSPNMLSFAESKAQQAELTVEFIPDKKLLANRKWPLVTCIGVFDYYPDPRPLLKELDEYLEGDARLVLTWPNALSPLGWFYFVGSRFTVPSTPRTPSFIRKMAEAVGLQVSTLLYAFPGGSPLGFTIVVEMRRQSLEHNSKVLP
jgi:2-polyprenyl-3-methyl-5-hydroxy-6-metoxy-1,4-benzoquinol methylase